METGLTLIERSCESIESFIVMFSGENWQISVEDLDDELRDIGSFPFLFLRPFDQKWQHAIKRFEENSRVKDYFFSLYLDRRGR